VRDQAGIVDLEQESRPNDRAVFLVHGLGQRRKIVLVLGIEFIGEIHFQIGRRDRSDEHLFHRRAGDRLLEIFNIGYDFRLTDIFDWSGADQRRHATGTAGCGRARAVHRFHLFVDSRKGERIARDFAQPRTRLVGRLQPGDARARICGKA
jgi:hypothetical protein